MKQRPASTHDLNIESLRPLLPPAVLLDEIPLSVDATDAVTRHRQAIAKVVHGIDRRLVVVVGPCSIHDPAAGMEYAQRLAPLAERFRDDLLVVMRTYFEKPRTTVGWKGLINDPQLDGSFKINDGLRLARRLLRDIAELGLPAAVEFLDPISPQFVADIVSWGAIGARTTESQVHRELASGLSMPVGFKNGTDGGVRVAVDGVISAKHPHSFLGVTEQGLAAIVSTRGNRDCHVILRGGSKGPNYQQHAVHAAVEALRAAELAPRVMIDVSHDNSGKDFTRQPLVTRDIAEQVASGEDGILGLMIESFLVEGKQKLSPGAKLCYGQSVTDGCIGWETTEVLLEELARAAAKRRSAP
jgi:3-deoxy-7-phosphoheptulonate synthase